EPRRARVRRSRRLRDRPPTRHAARRVRSRHPRVPGRRSGASRDAREPRGAPPTTARLRDRRVRAHEGALGHRARLVADADVVHARTARRRIVTARAQLREQQQALAREHVLDAAEAVVAERGLHDTKLREIAARAEYSVGALYQFFDGKGELLTAVLTRRNDA